MNAAARAEARPSTAIVVGGSLAGLMTALTLSRVGITVTVLERSGPVRSRGGGLFIPDGLVEQVTGWGSRTDQPTAPTSLIAGMHSWHTVYTALLHAAEHDPAVTLVHNTRAVTVGQDETTAWVTADSGTFHADLVVGADGHRSVVRRAVAPDHEDATFAGYLVWLASINEQDLPVSVQGDRRFDDGVFLGSDALLAAGSFPGADGTATPGHRIIGWAMYDSTHNDFLIRNGHVRNDTVHHSVSPQDITPPLRRELTAMVESRWPSPWREAMITSLRENIVLGTPITEYVPTRLVDGRLAIIGDAAHVATPMTGRGFTEALNDAEALADALDHARRTHSNTASTTTALLRYEKKRLRRARSTVESGQHFSRRFRPAA
ncbi:FAD-dependent monooxygenase [Rathayibacter sp. VKM Ac-2929]|uniref:FAD-dependent monooxygenase n=1 Tax=Rathayibacter sp. VKM Ac-2929 TaxID=2929480 RepID=UPI0035ABCD8A